MNQPRPTTPLAELHQLCRADYAKGQSQRATPTPAPSYTAAPLPAPGPLPVSSDLTVAISVAQKMLTAYSDTSTFGEFGYAQAHGALSESLRLLLRALDAEPDTAGTTPSEVRHANGLAFKVIPADSPYARIARNVRQLEMADGTVWTVGAPVGWFGIEAAWRPAPDQPASTPEQSYGGDVDQFIADAYDSLADSDLDDESVDEDARRSVDRAFPVVAAFLAEERADEVARWNAANPVGTPVTAYPGVREENGLTTRTRSEAWLLGGHTAVVKVDGHAGGIALTHVDVTAGTTQGEGEQVLAETEAKSQCGRCNKPFDPTDTSFDGRARHRDTTWCRSCVDNCHDGGTEHVCQICDPKRYGSERP